MATKMPPDITERIPALFSARAASAEATTAGVLYDVVISGVGLVFAVDTANPNLRESSPVQKQQIDTSGEAGEQTLDGVWVRSQTSWHLGAGADYYEPGNRDETIPSKYRFKDSRGVNVWDLGKLTLHPSMVAVEAAASTSSVVGARVGGDDMWFSFVGANVYQHDSGGTTTLCTPTFASSNQRIVNAGSVLLLGGGYGIRQVDIATGVDTTLCSQALGTACQPYWAKSRVITARAEVLHEHSLAGGAIDSTSVLYTHPDSGWTWSGVAETPDAILAAGYSGGHSAIYAFVLAEDTGGGTVPVLGQPFQVAELPPGEEIRSIRSYLGRYLGIGTTAGIRVGLIGTGGQVQYGPLIVETASPVVDLGARDSFLYAATGNSVIRVNLAETIGDSLRFPYAYDVEIPDGETITSLAFDGVTSRVVVGVDGVGTYEASETEYVTQGWLESGAIRYGTTAPKAFRSLDVTASTDSLTSVAVLATVAGVSQPLVTLSAGRSGNDIGLSSLPVPLESAGYKLELNAGTAATPTVEMVALKAQPVPKKRRMIQYPVVIADEQRDSKGRAFGYVGNGSDTLESLEALESASVIVTVKDLTRPEQFEATIEKVEFARVEPRARGNGRGNFGGIAKVTVQTL